MTYTIIIDNGVFLAKEPKPEGTWNIRMSLQKIEDTTIAHNKALKEWHSKLIPVENAHVSEHPIEGHQEVTIMKPVFQMANHGQQIPPENVTIKDGRATINKL